MTTPMTTHAQRPRRSTVEQERVHAALRDLFEHRISFNEVLGFKIVSFEPQATLVRFDMRPELVGHYVYGRLHGGVISAVLDATAGFALMLALADKHCDEDADQVMMRFARMGTVDLRIDYLRPGLGKHFDASATVIRLGGRIASTQMRLQSDDGKLVATGSGAYVIS
jgi:uncharacterized protein (TIGR00369 family)